MIVIVATLPAAVCPVEPAGAAAVRTSVWHGVISLIRNGMGDPYLSVGRSDVRDPLEDYSWHDVRDIIHDNRGSR